jgi:L-ascorbate metabolism protein UlaG (beta-lactamase superfamily)
MAVKRGIAETARKVGFTNVIELDAWETTTLGPVKVTAAPGKHKVPEITYVLEAEGFTVYFGADTLLIPELGEVAKRFPHIDLALFAVNGLHLRPLFNRQVVMNAQEAAQLCGMLRPRFAVPMHYAFTAGAFRDRFLLKYDGTPQEFQQAAAQHAAETTVRILAPGEPLIIPSRQPVH